MSELTYLNDDHKRFFETQLETYKVASYDRERVSLFYVLGLSSILREHINELYYEGGINPCAIGLEFQTSGTKALTRLAFVLYNDFKEQRTEDEEHYYSPSLLAIFCAVDRQLIPFMYQAISLRLGIL